MLVLVVSILGQSIVVVDDAGNCHPMISHVISIGDRYNDLEGQGSCFPPDTSFSYKIDTFHYSGGFF
ncbi:hypothetical protein TNCV_4465481 [Trichonephila clavipes]|nr:hypothetical protein TNCV_4465481 [Trichonephila clavipes]